MKKIVLITLLIVTAQYSYAQPLKAEEMLQMVTCTDNECITGMIVPKGYDVAFNEEEAASKVYAFSSKTKYQNESNAAIARPYTLKYTVHMEDSAVILNYTIGNKTEREMLLADFKHEGFDYVRATKTESTYDNVATIYESEKYPDIHLKVTNYQKKERRHTLYMEYDFELLKSTRTTK